MIVTISDNDCILFRCRTQPEHPRGALRAAAGRARAEHGAGHAAQQLLGGRGRSQPGPGEAAAAPAAGTPRLHLPRAVWSADELSGEHYDLFR